MIQHILIFLLLISCESEVQTTLNNNATNTDTIILNTSPVSYDLTPANTYKNIESIITLNYTDSELDLATSCTTSNLSNLTISSPCTCSLGTCTVGITGTLNYIGLASFDYSVTANNMISNTSSATFSINNIGASLTDQWIKVPANAGGMGLSAFYIMKYEAKGWNDLNANSDIDTGELDADGMGISLVSNKAVSVEDSTPWRMIDANDAASACESLGANYHLVSNDEWIAIARDLENVDTQLDW